MLRHGLWVSFESKNAVKKSMNSEVPFMHSFLFLFFHRFDKCTLRPYYVLSARLETGGMTININTWSLLSEACGEQEMHA